MSDCFTKSGHCVHRYNAYQCFMRKYDTMVCIFLRMLKRRSFFKNEKNKIRKLDCCTLLRFYIDELMHKSTIRKALLLSTRSKDFISILKHTLEEFILWQRKMFAEELRTLSVNTDEFCEQYATFVSSELFEKLCWNFDGEF